MRFLVLVLMALMSGCSYLQPRLPNVSHKLSEVSLLSPSIPKLIPRRGAGKSQISFLPLIHHENEEVFKDWDGGDSFEDYLFYKGYLIAESGDKIVPISHPDQLKVFLARSPSKR